MKNKLYVILLLALIAVSCILLCGCNHKHSFGEWQVETPSSCTADGLEFRICECGVKETRPMLSNGHSFSSEGVCSTCGYVCTHTYDANGVCAICKSACEHNWLYDSCTICNKKCNHDWNSQIGRCNVCLTYCDHNFDKSYQCIICKYSCEHNYWNNHTGTCSDCGSPCDHQWIADSDRCPICLMICEHQYDGNGVCTVCQKQCAHPSWTLGYCDKCSIACPHSQISYGVCQLCNSFATNQQQAGCTHSYVFGICSICGKQDDAVASTSKTYNIAEISLPNCWNVLNSYTGRDGLVLDYTEDTLYAFDYNADKTGYQIVPAMALNMPIEIPLTAELAQKWGFEADENGNYPQHHVWKVELRHDLKFDNGDAITAQTYVQTLMRLLDPEASNFNAESLYSGKLIIHNAENYVKKGSVIKQPAYKFFSDFTNTNSEFADKIVFDIENSYIGEYIVKEGYGTAAYLNAYGGWNGLASALWGIWSKEDLDALTGKTWAEIKADENLSNIWTSIITPWQTDPDEELHFFTTEYVYPQIDWSDVGLYAEDDYTLVFVLDNPLVGYDLLSNLNLPLVHIATYDSCAGEADGVYTNTYGTGVDTYVGYGPYKLVNFQKDTLLQFVKNDLWYGYNQPDWNNSLYQATGVLIRRIADEAVRLDMFNRGLLDTYQMQDDDLSAYSDSRYTYYTEDATTWFMAMNPSYEGLKQAEEYAYHPDFKGYYLNKTVLSIKEFRQALSLSLDRLVFQQTVNNNGQAIGGIFGNGAIADKNSGVSYRQTEQGKDVLLSYWGLTDQVCTDSCPQGCTTHKFATKDDAVSSITGQDLAQAKALFARAYDIAISENHIPQESLDSGKWAVHILISCSVGSSTVYNRGYQLLKEIWTDAVQGTPFEGHLSFSQAATLGMNYRDYLLYNQIDIIFNIGWMGFDLNPYALLEVFVDPQYKYDNVWDTATEQVVIELPLNQQGAYDQDGAVTKVVGTVYDWYSALLGKEITFGLLDEQGQAISNDGQQATITLSAGNGANGELRLEILAKLENEILQQYNIIPYGIGATAHLKGYRLSYPKEYSVYGIGYGGVKYLQFSMTDAEWAQAVANNGGLWDYSK